MKTKPIKLFSFVFASLVIMISQDSLAFSRNIDLTIYNRGIKEAEYFIYNNHQQCGNGKIQSRKRSELVLGERGNCGDSSLYRFEFQFKNQDKTYSKSDCILNNDGRRRSALVLFDGRRCFIKDR